MKKLFFIFLSLASLVGEAQTVTNHNAIFEPNMNQPAQGVMFTDPVFNSSITRITDARAANIEGAFPDYSKRQAWNADESFMMLRSGNGDVMIHNGTTYQYLQTLPGFMTGLQDVFWHPTNVNLIYFISGNTFNTVDVSNLNQTLIHNFSNYDYVTTRAEGNLSNNGRYIALCGYDVSGNPVDFFVYDVFLDSVISTFNVSGNVFDFDWISISSLGNYVVVDYADQTIGRYHGVEVYDQQLNFLWQKPLGAGHSDLGLDANGTEILIMDVYDPDSNLTYIKKFGLSDSSTLSLLGVSADFDLHESCRSMNRPGWVYVSTFDYVGRLTDDSLSWLPFEDEIFSLKMDGSGSVQRLAHHFSKRYSPSTPNSDSSVYFAEPHATANMNGTKILFGSNWRLNIQSDTSVDAYVADVNALITSTDNKFSVGNTGQIKIFPNPADLYSTVEFHLTKPQNVFLKVTDLAGKVISHRKNYFQEGKNSFNVETTNLSAGIYFLELNCGEFGVSKKLQVVR